MKRNFSIAIAFLTGIAFTTFTSWNKTETPEKFSTPNPGANPVIAIRTVKLKPNVSQPTFETFAAGVGSDEYGVSPGIKMWFAKGERGDEVGSYILVVEFDSKQTRDHYYPDAGSGDST